MAMLGHYMSSNSVYPTYLNHPIHPIQPTIQPNLRLELLHWQLAAERRSERSPGGSLWMSSIWWPWLING